MSMNEVRSMSRLVLRRKDLFSSLNLSVPDTWDQLMFLAELPAWSSLGIKGICTDEPMEGEGGGISYICSADSPWGSSISSIVFPVPCSDDMANFPNVQAAVLATPCRRSQRRCTNTRGRVRAGTWTLPRANL